MTFNASKYFFMTQNELKILLYEELKMCGYHPVMEETYLYAEGNIPIALSAHLDTVFPEETRKNLHARIIKESNILFAEEGLGADDRAGVIMIMKIVMTTKLRPHIIFTTNEESDLRGAIDLALAPMPFTDLGYIIQLDRRGQDDCVFYDNINRGFQKYINSFGFTTALGAYTDISIICPHWGVAGVNLSVGYVNEHSVLEMLYVDWWKQTYKKVLVMLKRYAGEHWIHIENKYKENYLYARSSS